VVEKRLVYMTPEWKEAFRFTTRLADSLGLEMAIAGSPGWSESGGPWVPAKDGMKKYVWSEVRVKGGQTFNGQLPKPPSNTGVFQNLPMQAELGDAGEHKSPPVFYKDVAVIAYKLLDADKTLAELKAVVTSSGGNFTLQQLTDGDLAATNLLPSDTTKGYAWIQFYFPKPQTIKAITITGGGDKGPFGLFGELKETRSMEVSDDGVNFKWICYIPAGNILEQTIAIPATTASYFRVTFRNPPPPLDLAALFGIPGIPPPKAPAGTDVAELLLSPVARVHRFEEKAAFAPADDLSANTGPASSDVIDPGEVIDVTDKMNSDGVLNWTAPPGNWKIVRFGYSLLGITNHPASPEATGLEVDKLDPLAIKAYFTQYLDQYKSATGGLMGSNGGLQFMVTDSWEAGAQNWTPNMLQEFQKRRGYSMIPYMPVLTGHVVKSAAASDDFLWDFRKTLSEMVAEYHYDGLTNILQQYGMKRYSESHEDRRALIADGMDVKRKAAVPMSAMWMPKFPGDSQTVYIADIRESASVAHIYGQNLVSAESLTAAGTGGKAWSYAPEQLKPTADLELASGLNRFVIHTSVHQPADDKIPGLGLGSVGQWFNRHETWAGQAKAWTDYLSRSSYLLQQGTFVADIVYYYGEDNNITALFGKKLPDVPEGYNYDFINADALL
ncbi:MAG: discoidin domain-containing protein, partial [Bacteroidota bacterium]|nr:discoidin domain-containing protein [Bacteroidota bacterium]